MKTPMSSEIMSNWSLEEPPKHVLTVPSLLREESARGREIGLIIDLSNHETLYAEDLAAANNVEYAHIQVFLKSLLSVVMLCLPAIQQRLLCMAISVVCLRIVSSLANWLQGVL